eukprot:jgi/Ulvmu1/9999/UM059_0048.1
MCETHVSSKQARCQRCHWCMLIDMYGTRLWQPNINWCSAGCTGVIVSEKWSKDPRALAETIKHCKVTHLVAVPSLLAGIAHAASRCTSQEHSTGAQPRSVGSMLSCLRYVVSSGDVLWPHVVKSVQQHLSDEAVMLNVYGCTETTADAMYCAFPTNTGVEVGLVLPVINQADAMQASGNLGGKARQIHQETHESVPLGLPIGFADVYLLPVENAGTLSFQLLVTGPCIADGYFCGHTNEPMISCLEHLRDQEAGTFIYVSACVLQHLADRGLRIRDENATESSASIDPVWAFLTADLVTKSQDSCKFEARIGNEVKVSGRMVSLEVMDRLVQAGLTDRSASVLSAAIHHPVLKELCIVTLINNIGSDSVQDALDSDAVPADSDDPSNSLLEGLATSRLSPTSERKVRHALTQNAPNMPQPAAMLLANHLPQLPSGKVNRAAVAKLRAWETILHPKKEADISLKTHMELSTQPSGPGTHSGVKRGRLSDAEAGRPAQKVHPVPGQVTQGPAPCGPVSEAAVMRACFEALQGTDMLAGLEPSSSLLEIGATSLHVLVIASLLDCSLELVYEHPTPRSLAQALLSGRSTDPAFRSNKTRPRSDVRPSQETHASGTIRQNTAPEQSKPAALKAMPASKPDVRRHESKGSMETAAHGLSVRNPGALEPAHASEGQQGEQGYDGTAAYPVQSITAAVQVHVCDSRGESACLLVSPSDLPHPQAQDTTDSSRAHDADSIAVQLRACVDAPVTLLQCTEPRAQVQEHPAPHGPKQAGKQATGDELSKTTIKNTCCLYRYQSWLLACSHAGEIVCLAFRPKSATLQDKGVPAPEKSQHSAVPVPPPHCRRIWTAEVPSPPDAGLQVTGCGRAVAVACLNGTVAVLRLRDGQHVGQLQTCGQLRRAPVLDPWWRLFWCHGHGLRLQAAEVSCSSPLWHEDSRREGPRHGVVESSNSAAVSSGCVSCAAVAHVGAASSALVRFLSTSDFKLVVSATLKGEVFALSVSKHAGGQSGQSHLVLQQHWATDVGSPIFSSPEVATDGAGSPSIVVASVSGHVKALCPHSGGIVWQTHLGGQIFADLRVSDLCLPGQTQPKTAPRPQTIADRQSHIEVDKQRWDELYGISMNAPTSVILVSVNSPDTATLLCARTGTVMSDIAQRDTGPVATAPVPLRGSGEPCHRGNCAADTYVERGTVGRIPSTACCTTAVEWLQVVNAGTVIRLCWQPLRRASDVTVGPPKLQICSVNRGGAQSFSGAVVCMCGKAAMLGRRDNKVHLVQVK